LGIHLTNGYLAGPATEFDDTAAFRGAEKARSRNIAVANNDKTAWSAKYIVALFRYLRWPKNKKGNPQRK
jgi:hypothetical protein